VVLRLIPASTAGHPIKEGVTNCSFQAKCVVLHLTTCSGHSQVTKQLLCLRALLLLPFTILRQTCHLWISYPNSLFFFQFIGKDTKYLSVKNQPYVVSLETQSVNDEYPFPTAFADLSVKQLKGQISSQVSGRGCHCCGCTIAGSQFSCLLLTFVKIFLLVTSCVTKSVASRGKGLRSIPHPKSRMRAKTYSLRGGHVPMAAQMR